MTNVTNTVGWYPRYLWFLLLAYAMVITMANWFDARIVQIAFFPTEAGTLIFPFTYLLSDLITEVYGYKHARRAIWCGFLFNAIYLGYAFLVSHMPSPDFAAKQNQLFDQIILLNTRIIIASAISYLCSEPLNSYCLAKMKLKTGGEKMWLRFSLSTIVASGADSVLFCLLAFVGVFTLPHVLTLIGSMWFMKVSIELIGLPLSLKLARVLKQREQLDIYDAKTDFTLLSLDASYHNSENRYRLQD